VQEAQPASDTDMKTEVFEEINDHLAKNTKTENIQESSPYPDSNINR
jgi:hypothetical protein